MKYCIYQIDDQSNEKIISVIDDVTEFLENIKENIKDKFNYKLLESLSENDIKVNNCFTENHYLLVNDKQIKLVQKYKKVNAGYIYSTSKDAVKVIYTWKLIPFECDISLLNGYKLLSNDSDSESSLDNSIEYINDNIDISFFESTNMINDIMCSITEIPNPDYEPKIVNVNDREMKIKILDLDEMESNPSICIIAMRGSGKSWDVTTLLNKHKKEMTFDNTLIMSRHDKIHNFYGHIYPNLHILHDYEPKIINKFLLNQENKITYARDYYIKNYRKNHLNNDDLTNDKNYINYMQKECQGYVVLDDCLNSKGSWMSDKAILDLFYNHKQHYVTFIITMQFPLGLTPELRQTFDYVFLLSEDFYSNQKRLYDHYVGMIPSFETFRTIFLQLTPDYGNMVIKQHGENTLDDKIYYFKSKTPSDN